MTDIESQIFDKIYKAVRANHPTCNVLGEMVRETPKFPCVFVEEIENTCREDTIDNGGEKFSNIVYEFNVYTNDATGKKAKAKAIMNVIDSTMSGLGFRRATSQPFYYHDTQIYRIVVRYRATLAKDQTIYRG